MARTAITSVQLSGNLGADALVTGSAADATNQNKAVMGSRIRLLFRNTGATLRSCTVTSAPDVLGRTGDKTFTLAAGAAKMVGPLDAHGWKQSDGSIYFEAAHAEVFITPITE